MVEEQLGNLTKLLDPYPQRSQNRGVDEPGSGFPEHKKGVRGKKENDVSYAR